ncbi:MAG: molecular chaperone HtpG [Lachnospiraceae bacterium]|nr:molecular chaperone HtpG [Lachnospiraceae bacterium]
MEKTQFKSESKRLLDLMINSIYTHKEIFLREIISNASDAIDKLFFVSLTDDKVGLNREDFKIKLALDKENRTITVSDNGIGMDKNDLENNLGTIASSGSYKFKQENEKTDDVDIIGQFGVGFYSAFMVSSEIKVITKKYGNDTAYIWESTGADGYTITETEKDEVGTTIIIKVKEDTENEKYSDYLEQYRISALVTKYSDYIRYPIVMKNEHKKMIEGTMDDPQFEVVAEDEILNSMVPIWQRSKKDVTAEEYNEFYKQKFFDFEDPMHVISTSVEGVVTYKSLLFIPNRVPFNYYTKEYKRGLQLYSSGVLIMESCEDLLPEHFAFVKGVVDSQDLSLNISREMLQHDRQLKTIASNIEKKIKNELAALLKNDRDKYEKFFANFGRQLKFGIVSDYGAHKEAVKDLVLFYSSTEKKLVTLKEYVERMGEEQKEIYFATGDSIENIDRLPQIEGMRDQGIEILYCPEQIDEFAMQGIGEYDGKMFKNIVNDDIDTPDGDDEKKDDVEVLTFIKNLLGDKVNDVVFSKKLKTHPVCMTAKGGVSFEMEKYMAIAQPEAKVKAERVLEINASHPAVNSLIANMTADKEKAEKYAKLLYSQALLIAGLQLEDPSEYAELVCSLMV